MWEMRLKVCLLSESTRNQPESKTCDCSVNHKVHCCLLEAMYIISSSMTAIHTIVYTGDKTTDFVYPPHVYYYTDVC